MKMKLMAALAALAMAAPVLSHAMGNKLSAGEYTAALTPAPSEATADKIEARLGKIDGLGAVDVETDSGTLQFTVKDGMVIEESKIKDAVKSVVKTKMGAAVAKADASGRSTGTTAEPSRGY